MKLYHNADVTDLISILENGLLPMSVTNNNKWEGNRRADNRTDAVYLFNPLRRNSFTQYGICLVEVETDTAVERTMVDNDVNKGEYTEYTVNAITPRQIKRVYIPEIFKEKASQYVPKSDKVVWCEMYAEEITGSTVNDDNRVELIYSQVSEEELEQFARTASIEVDSLNYFRGISAKNEMIDLYNINYKF